MSEPTLYILMRTDMDSMNAGKGMAQAAHAANTFAVEAGEDETNDAFFMWQCQTQQSFGTTIVLGVDNAGQMKDIVEAAREEGFHASVIHDPSYPVRDGKVTHLIPVDTCAFVFTPCRVSSPPPLVDRLGLHP